MSQYICNPLNLSYRYQFNKNPMGSDVSVNREAADPSIALHNGKFYMFASMSLGVWVSEDLANWEYKKLPNSLPLYDYAPDIRVIGEYAYFCANRPSGLGRFFCSRDILYGPYEEIETGISFADPALFEDEDGRVYLYWGLSSSAPIWGVELDRENLTPLGQRHELIWGDPYTKGYERVGEDNTILPCSEEELERRLAQIKSTHPAMADFARDFMRDAPYIEGAWMNKHEGTYYLQYAAPGTQLNTYGDGVYVSDNPLGPFRLAENSPFSYKPGGFAPGAGHGSTLWDGHGNLWHAGTMRISVHHQFERRLGLWPAGFDQDGELFCNQRYGDWPMRVEAARMNPWAEPEWFLLSYNKPVTASSHMEGKGPEKAADENIQTWWLAADENPGQWLQMDLGQTFSVHAIQINFADDKINKPIPADSFNGSRYIDEANHRTRWTLEGSLDKAAWFTIEDKSGVSTDLPHDFIVREEGFQVHYLRLTILELPYNQRACVSGLRVFGRGTGEPPAVPAFRVERAGDTDMDVTIDGSGAVGYNILWGHAPEKLYHSYMVFAAQKRIGALVKGQPCYVRVDAFNENGVCEGKIVKLGEQEIRRL